MSRVYDLNIFSRILLKVKQLSFLLLWFFLSNRVVEAANLPVSASLSINPPYSIYLNDYTESAIKMNLSLFVADLEIENLRVRLRITIEGNGISIHSKPEYMPTPILLNGGSSEFIDGQELLGYLSTQNLNYQGPGRDQFYANSKLPEGIYRFCIEVIEINRNAVVSNQACATSWVILNDPPIWNLPTQSEIVRATNPQNILFNWTPRHTGSPNAAFSVLYEVTMVEIFPEGRNANDAINSQAPFHQFTTTETQFVMSPSDPTLTPGRSYAVRLKAIDQLGYDLFKNQGFSEVLMFTFGEPCNAPTDIAVNNISQKSADISWLPSAKNTAFRVDLREVSTTSPYPISDWYSLNYNTQKATLYKLESGKKYEYKLYGNCQTLISEPTLSDYFSTNPATNPDFNCNQNLSLSILGKIPTKFELPKIGQYLDINGLKIKIADIRQVGTDKLSGTALLEIPFLKGLSIPIEFSDIRLSDKFEALPGGKISFPKNFNDLKALAVSTVKDNLQPLVNEAKSQVASIPSQVQNTVNQASNVAQDLQNKAQDAKNTVQNASQNVQQLSNEAAKTVGNVQGAANNVQGAVSQGAAAVGQAAGNATQPVQTATNAANNFASTLAGADKVKELLEKILRAKKDTVNEKDKTNKSQLAIAENDYIALKKEIEGEVYQTEEEQTEAIEAAGESESEESMYSIAEENSLPEESDKPASKSLLIATSHKTYLRFEQINITKMLSWLEKHQNIDAPDFNNLLSDFKVEAADILKDMALNALQGKQQEDLEKRIKEFVNKKIDSIING